MKIGSFSPAGNTVQQQAAAPERLQRDRDSGGFTGTSPKNEKKVAPEEILDKITALTDNGTHSVRFEMDKDIQALVVKIYDRQTEELVRQIPAEELLETAKDLRNYRGLLVDDKG
ncbi:MAG: flagellar protein FlaG [Trichloromonas sp.]|jgi:flagellar protein FlaG|nr:flagellar protein FlaG [Trichloromonas sp.]